MSGIIGYIGEQNASSLIINGLKKLEHICYDSAGVALLVDNHIKIFKKKGKIAEVKHLIDSENLTATLGIGHTRWASHGLPNDLNAHPHLDKSGRIAIVHNGIIENFAGIKAKLTSDGYTFNSETDSEVLAVFIGAIYEKVKNFEKAVKIALAEAHGVFGLVALSLDEPEKLISVRRGSPVILGICEGGNFVASCANALPSNASQIVELIDNEMAIITKCGYTTETICVKEAKAEANEIGFNIEAFIKSECKKFMIGEIFEQPQTFKNALSGRLLLEDGLVKIDALKPIKEKLRSAKRVIIAACGTSWHVALIGEYLIEQMARIPVEVEFASEFSFRNPIINSDDIVIGISQSGETVETLSAIREAKRKGATTIGIVNVIGCSIAREADAVIYTHATPEIGLAATKAFTTQIAVLSLIGLYLGRMRDLSLVDGRAIAKELSELPNKIQQILNNSEKIRQIAIEYAKEKSFLFIGRSNNYAVALLGAEISFIHAEAFPGGEIKHGPIALIEKESPVIFIAPQNDDYARSISNIEEVRACDGQILAIATEGDENIKNYAKEVIYIPSTLSIFTPVLTVVPLQLFSYYIARALGKETDKAGH